MKVVYKTQLIKDIIIAGIAWAVGFGVAFSEFYEDGVAGFFFAFMIGLIVAGVPFGWRWLSNIFSTLSFYMIAIKGVLSLFLGWIALPIVIVKDIIAYKNAE